MNPNVPRPFTYTRGGSTPFHSYGYRPHNHYNHHNRYNHHHNHHHNEKTYRPHNQRPNFRSQPRGNDHPHERLQYSYERPHYKQHQNRSSVAPPKNHSWEQEHAAANICQDYESIATVMWVEDIYGEVLCEKNLVNSRAHFYFDGSTEIDGQTVANAARGEGGLKIEPGTKVEIFCKYTPIDDKVPHLVRILKISIYGRAPVKELEQLCMVSFTNDPHKPKLAMDSSADFVLISPVLFSKEWALKSIHSTMVGEAPNYPELEKGQFIVGRTLLGTVIKAPRWMVDGGTTYGKEGNPANNVRKLLIGIDQINPIIVGQATIVHVVPFQCALLEADDRPGELMYFPIVCFPLNFKQQIIRGNRVYFAACKNLDNFNYPWRVVEIAFQKSGAPYHFRTAAKRSMYGVKPTPEPQVETTLVAVDSSSCETAVGVEETPPVDKKVEWEDIFGISEGTSVPLHQNDLEEYLKETSNPVEEVPTPQTVIISPGATFPPVSNSSFSGSLMSISLESLQKAEPTSLIAESEHLIFLEPSADPDLIQKVLGYGKNDTEPAVRSQARHRKKRDFNHQVMTIAERLAEEQRKREEERREAAYQLELPGGREMRLKLQEGFAKVRKDVPATSVEKVEKVEKEEKLVKAAPQKSLVVSYYEEPVPGMRTIGLYDDVCWIFELSLIRNEERKQHEKARQEAEKQKKKAKGGDEEGESEVVEQPFRPKDGFWTRRRGPRPLPAFYVAELLSNRTEKEICQEHDVSSLISTVVLRNPRTRHYEEAIPFEDDGKDVRKEVEKMKKEEKKKEAKENAEEEKKPPVEAKPVPFKSKLLDDQIIANFMQPLLKKRLF